MTTLKKKRNYTTTHLTDQTTKKKFFHTSEIRPSKKRRFARSPDSAVYSYAPNSV